MNLESFHLRTIYDSRVNPTVEAEVNGVRAAAPAGASAGSHAVSCFVPEELSTIENDIRTKVDGAELTQEEFDSVLQEVDGSDDFSRIGSVSIAASLAFAKAQGFEYGGKFPYPLGNLVGGGAHGGNTTIQEFMVCPVDAKSMPEAVQMLSEAYHLFKEKYGQRIRGVNDESAYVTNMSDEETLEAVKKVADEVGLAVGIDAAATDYWNSGDNQYEYAAMNMALPPKQQVKFMETLVDRFDLFYVEDPFHEEDFENLAELTKRTDTLIVGDDVFVTQKERLQRGLDIDAGNSLIIKPNQVGTVTGTRETFELATENGYTPVISHRSGETCDPVIADMAVAWGAPLIKDGIAGIRTAKNNQLLRLWDENGGEMANLPV